MVEKGVNDWIRGHFICIWQREKRKNRCPCLNMHLADKADLKGSLISIYFS